MTRRVVFALSLGVGLALGLLWLLGGQNSVALANPGILYVAPGGDCGGATPCYATVQEAVDAANADDEIRVAAGTYTGVSARAGVTQTVYIDKTVIIRGGYTTGNWMTPDPAVNPTTLDAQGQGRGLVITGTIAPTITGLRITGGDATGLGRFAWGSNDVGGGIYVHVATAVISDNLVYSNTAGGVDSSGGGLCLINSNATLSGNTISGNTADNGDGLYLYASPATLTGNTIRDNGDNVAGWGGGLYLCYSSATLNGNTITGNRGGYGGGVNVQGGGATLSDNAITGNTGYRGGGLYLYVGAAALNNNVVTGNTASDQGGGVYFWSNTSMLINTVVTDNTLSGGSGFGAGIYIDGASAPRLLHSTIARNSGGDGSGLCVTNYGSLYSTVVMTNTILVGHTAGIRVTEGNTAILNATLWHGNTTDWDDVGTMNHSNDHSGDPAFASDGYHLAGASAAIDAGVDAGVTTDIDGEARPQGAGYDIGADEFSKWYVYLPVVMKNYAH